MPVKLVDIPDETDINCITLKWKVPHNNGAPITKYTIYKRTVNEGSTEMAWDEIPVSRLVRSYNMKLEKGKAYEFQVTATNMCGEGLKGKQDVKKIMVLGEITSHFRVAFSLSFKTSLTHGHRHN